MGPADRPDGGSGLAQDETQPADPDALSIPEQRAVDSFLRLYRCVDTQEAAAALVVVAALLDIADQLAHIHDRIEDLRLNQ